ncbi:MAG: FHA domain-containing protein FhaB/FipA [Actinomycetota bacterium]
MSELTLTVIKIGFLALLWLFVITGLSVMRSDIYGSPPAARPARGPAPRPRKPARSPRPRKGLPSKVVVTQGALAGTSLGLGDAPVTIGRAADSTLVLTDDYASTRHARLFPRDGQWFVEDLGSTNGTYLDRQKVNGPTPVPLGVPIRIGKTVLELRK